MVRSRYLALVASLIGLSLLIAKIPSAFAWGIPGEDCVTATANCINGDDATASADGVELECFAGADPSDPDGADPDEPPLCGYDIVDKLYCMGATPNNINNVCSDVNGVVEVPAGHFCGQATPFPCGAEWEADCYWDDQAKNCATDQNPLQVGNNCQELKC